MSQAQGSAGEPKRPYIGGQAVIEGVMMRSPGSISIVCRRINGELVVRERPMPGPSTGPRSWPLLRGMITLVESIRLGSRALRWSAELYEKDAREQEEAERARAATKSGVLSTLALATALPVLAVVTRPDGGEADGEDAPQPLDDEGPKKGGGLLAALPLLFAVVLFVALPQAGAEGINKLFFDQSLQVTSPLFQMFTGMAKLIIVTGYLLLIRRIPEVRRVFQYHGAEHKTISTYEANEPLVVANARAKTTMHARCGTTFLVMVALVSIVVFSAAGGILGGLLGGATLPGGRIGQNVLFFLLKLPFLPLVAAVTFEIQRVFARYCTTGPLQVLLWPGFLVQKITTAEPDDAQLEVALASLRATLWREEAQAAPAQPDRVFADYGQVLADPGYARSAA
jgi:uncharacterized protein YqhQ